MRGRYLVTVLLCGGLLLASHNLIYGQNSRPVVKPQAYRDLLNESDLRVAELKKSLAQGQAAPVEFRLRYAGSRGDYLEFYDLNGDRVYYRYREDRFDRKAERKITVLIEGEAYTVSGKLTGLLSRDEFIPPEDNEFKSLILLDDSLPVFNYEGVYPLRLEQMIWQ